MSCCDREKSQNQILFTKVRDVKDPQRGTAKSAGIDFFVPEYNEQIKKDLWQKNPGLYVDDKMIKLHSLQSVLIPSGLKVLMPDDNEYAFIGFNKSGVAVKKNLRIGACVIDQDYDQEMHIHLTNTSGEIVQINFGEKISQFILIPVVFTNIAIVDESEYQETFDNLHKTTRTGGFGHTGDK